jgi:flagellar FliL protein
MKRHLICLLALFMLGTVLAPAWAEEGAPAKAESKSDAKKADKPGEEGKNKKSDEDVSGGRFAGDPIYVHIAPLVMPMITADGVEQIITLQIDVEVKDFDVADNIHANMPRIRDALMRGLYGSLGDGSVMNGKMVDVAKVKAKAASALQTVVGMDGIREVLVQGIAQRVL